MTARRSLAAFLTSLPLAFPEAVRQAAGLGFTHVDVVALVERPADHLDALADAGVLVSCAALGRGLPDEHTLDAADVGIRRATLDALRQQVADAARLGATCAYLVPGVDTSRAALTYFAEGCGLLADYAERRMVRLCVEHIPGRALGTVARTLDWLEESSHAGLGLLLDVGHCLISGEDVGEAARRADERLAYLHLDDNDGVGDLHWPLLTGRLTRTHLHDLATALRTIDYRGGMALELNPANADPTSALREGKVLAEQYFSL
jgi:sugar phosphate isomerase/epimerase